MSQQTQRRPVGERPRVRRPAAEIVGGADAPSQAMAESSDVLTVGAARDNTLVVTDRSVSRYHVELTAAPGGVRVTDVGSLNGTWLGAVRLSDAVVPVGTVVTLGETSLRVADADAVLPDTEEEAASIEGLVAHSAAMKRVTRSVARLARSNVSVLIRGETGTGKEGIARALHDLGPRADRPFVVVDCGSMPATLVASELFGHERGAFTGANRRHHGAFERAHGGTLFLDEIGELPLLVQPALLGALERRAFRRVGGSEDKTVDVRVVAATHRDLRAEVNADRFRADLYYRLAVATIRIPALRDRTEDIEPLVRHFVTLMTGNTDLPFGPDTIAALEQHRWTGNVRELRNVVEAAVAMGELQLDGTRPGLGNDSVAELGSAEILPYKTARARVLTDFEEDYLGRLIGHCQGNASEASRLAQMDRQYLLTLLRKHGLR